MHFFANETTAGAEAGVIKSGSHCACILTTEGASYLALPGIKNHFLLRSASLRASLRRKEKGFFLPYPAFTSQRVRQTAPTLTRHAGLLSGRPCRGWFLVAWTIDSHF